MKKKREIVWVDNDPQYNIRAYYVDDTGTVGVITDIHIKKKSKQGIVSETKRILDADRCGCGGTIQGRLNVIRYTVSTAHGEETINEQAIQCAGVAGLTAYIQGLKKEIKVLQMSVDDY